MTHLAAGLGFKPSHLQRALAARHPGLWFEVHAENYMVDGGPRPRLLQALGEMHPVSLHGVSMSLAGAEPPDPDHLRRFAALVCRVQPVQVSEHLAWSRLGARYEPDLLPFVRNAQSLQRVVNQLHPVEGHLLAPTSPTEGRWRVQGDAGTVEVPIESSACRARRP
ncbi:MAG: DUF692 family multinuclear iron-containing protein, partial [Pseudomonadota bacterium]